MKLGAIFAGEQASKQMGCASPQLFIKLDLQFFAVLVENLHGSKSVLGCLLRPMSGRTDCLGGNAMLVIYRTDDKKAKPFSKKRQVEVEEALATARVQRPDLVEYFSTAAINKLPVLPEQYRNAPRLRALHKTAKKYGWIVPASNCGRAATINQSTANSVRLWLKKNLGVDGDSFMLVVEDDDC